MDTQRQDLTGMTVRASDGDKVGTIVEVSPTYIVVEKGFFFPSDHYVPRWAISSVGDDEVFLSVTKDQALNQGWEQQPAGWGDPTYRQTAYGRTGTVERGFAAEDRAVAGDESLRVPVYEEDIAAVKRDVDRGAVRVEKDVVAEDRVVDVPVTEERVRVTRVEADDPGAVGADAFAGGVIEVPVRGQEVDVATTARKAGEVVVEKEAETRTERVGGTVRREEVRVEDDTVDADRR